MPSKKALKTLGLCLFAGCLVAPATVAVAGDSERREDESERIAWMDHQRHHGAWKGGYLGVGLTELTPELRTHFGVPEEAGVMVAKVVDDSPASRAGIQVGDIVSAVDGEPVSSGRALAQAIRQRQDGDAATLEIWRDRRVETLTATIEERRGTGFKALHRHRHGHRFDCDGGDCDVRMECEDGECDCSINGESVDCIRLHEKHSGDR